jgi:glycosyltransferase involved in cell wall biosynthesis
VARRICIPSEIRGIGGPASFQRKMSHELGRLCIETTNYLGDHPYQAVILINASRHLLGLLRCKSRGIPIVQRLGGLNWRHKHTKANLVERYRPEIRNLMMRFTRTFLADSIVYQSWFARNWWEKAPGVSNIPNEVIHNGVDLSAFCPKGPKYDPKEDICLISVEGTQECDNVRIALRLARNLRLIGHKVQLLVFGRASGDALGLLAEDACAQYKGIVRNAELPFYYRGAHLYVSTDVIAACPNSVIESLACGTPVIGYHAGALPELIDSSSGRCVPPKGDLFAGEKPGNEAALLNAALEILDKGKAIRDGSRETAERRFDVHIMVDRYVSVLENAGMPRRSAD